LIPLKIFTNTFIDNLRERANLGIKRGGEPTKNKPKRKGLAIYSTLQQLLHIAGY